MRERTWAGKLKKRKIKVVPVPAETPPKIESSKGIQRKNVLQIKKEAEDYNPPTASPASLGSSAEQKRVRKNALQLKKEIEEEEKEMLEKEKFWETPAFLRKKI